MNNHRNNNPPLSGKMDTQGKSVLTSLKTAAKKALHPSSESDHSLSNAIAAVHIENSRILNRVGRFVKDEPGIEDPEDVHETIDNRQGDSNNAQTISEELTTTELAVQDSPLQSISSSTVTILSSGARLVNHPSDGVSLSILSPAERPRKAIFLRNLAKPIFRTAMPKVGHRFNSTLQLAFGHRLLSKELSSLSSTTGSFATTCYTAPEPELVLDEAEEAWVTAIEQDTAGQDHVRTLTSQVVAEFINAPHKDVASIAEIVLLGSVLEREDYRSVLSSLIEQVERQSLLKVKLLQGLVQFLQEASPGYLIDDDLIRILRSLRQRLKDTHKMVGDTEHSASDHIYHLVVTICRVLDALVEGNIKGLHRTEDHKPLLDILTELRDCSDPHLKFHASYAWQGLRYVGDDESPLCAALRFGGGLTMAALGVASVFKFDPENLFKGLQQLGLAAGQAYDVAKAGVEGAQALRAGGEGVMDSMLKGFRSGAKRAWYPALQGARVCIREGRLADFERIVYEAPCRGELEFQQGVCQLLGEVALDPIWEIRTRQQAVNFLVELHRSIENDCFDAGVKMAIFCILSHISETAEQIIQDQTVALLQDLSLNNAYNLSGTYYLLMVRLPQPTASPLLSRALRATVLEDKVQLMMSLRRDEYRQGVYIPPQGKAIRRKLKDESEDDFNDDSEDESNDNFDDRPFSLLDKVMKFLKSDQQVFLILGDSGAGKSTFDRHLEHQLVKSYSQGGPIPILIILPAIARPEKELIQEQLKMYDFSEDDIRDLKQDRQFIIICDGYDESQLSINLHSTNSFNRPGQWDVKMVISCRNTYLGKGYRERFEPQPIDRHSPATPHLFQEAVIVPFSSGEIVDYVEQFVQDIEVHELFDGRPVWSVEDYMDKLGKIPKLRSLVKNPFLLVLVLRALPVIVDGVLELSEIEVTRVRIYEIFIEQWLDINRKRLCTSKLSKEETEALEELIGEGFTNIAVKFLKDLALAIFEEQDGNPVVRYVHRVDKTTWKAKFFGQNPEVVLLRAASPLRRSGILYRFIHRSFLEYFYDFIEQNIFQLKNMRLREYERLFKNMFIPCYAKRSLLDPDGASLPLMLKVRQFLKEEGHVFLVLGDSGAGKSMFNRHLECELWADYKRGGRIPLHINLPAIDRPDQDLIAKQLAVHGFKDDQIQEMKLNRQFVVICDGYDESQLRCNLYESNHFNQPDQWNVRMVISCRSAYLNKDYRERFEPVSAYKFAPISHLFQEAVVVPFSSHQIEAYVGKFVQEKETRELFNGSDVWGVEEYMEKLRRIPNMMELVKNPFLLTLSLRTLPSVCQDIPDVTTVKATRLMLYDRFIDQWIQVSHRRVKSVVYSSSADVQAAFEELVNEGFAESVMSYSKNLAAHIVTKHDNNPFVQYDGVMDRGTWKESFFGIDARTRILMESSPITRSGNLYRFIHRSFVEYFYSLSLIDPPNLDESFSESADSILPAVSYNNSDAMAASEDQNHAEPKTSLSARTPLLISFPQGTTSSPTQNSISYKPISHAPHTTPLLSAAALNLALPNPSREEILIRDSSTLRFLAERVQQHKALKQQFFASIERSKSDPSASISAANSITVLTRAGERFSGMDLSGIRIPGADVSGADFDSTSLAGADLTAVNLTRTWLRQANLCGAQMTNVQFGEWPYIRLRAGINVCTYSPNGQLLAIGFSGGAISLFSTKTWLRARDLAGHNWTITALAFSRNGQQLASGSEDKSVKLWDVVSNTLEKLLLGPGEAVTSIEYSPEGDRIAVASDDGVVRLYDLDTFDVTLELQEHTSAVKSVAYSLSGDFLATASSDWTVRLWTAKTGVQTHVLRGHTACVTSVSISPINSMVASGGRDLTVRLWDGTTGMPLYILRGHTAFVKVVYFSPSGHQLASSGDDRTVRLWDGMTGTPGALLAGHSKSVLTLAYSPDGNQIATGGKESKVRLWDANVRTLLDDLSPFLGTVESTPHSPFTQRRNPQYGIVWGPSTADPQALPPNLDKRPSCDTSSGINWSDHSSGYGSVAVSLDGNMVASSVGNLVRLLDADTGVSMADLRGHTDSVTSVAFSHDGKFLASGSHDKTAQIWNALTGERRHKLTGHTEAVTALAISPTGAHITTGSDDRLVMVWSTRTGKVCHILSGHSQEIRCLSYSPNREQMYLASGSRDNSIKLWEAQGCVFDRTLKGHTNVVESVSFSRDGKRLISGSRDGTARVWDVSSGRPKFALTGHRKAVAAVAFSPNSLFIATGSWDKTVMIWDAQTGEYLVQVARLSGEVCSIVWKPIVAGNDDSLYFVTGCSDRSVRMWKLVKTGDGTHRIQLHWRSSFDGLVASSANIQNVVGLSRNNEQLLTQRGAVGEPRWY